MSECKRCAELESRMKDGKDLIAGYQEMLDERDERIAELEQELAKIQTCKNGHKFVANSHEYVCPSCQLAKHRWIPVSEAKPDTVYYCCRRHGEESIYYFAKKGLSNWFSPIGFVTGTPDLVRIITLPEGEE